MATTAATQVNAAEETSRDTAHAARILGVTTHVMIRWRHERRGPPYIRLARNLVRYQVADLLNYMTAHRVGGA